MDVIVGRPWIGAAFCERCRPRSQCDWSGKGGRPRPDGLFLWLDFVSQEPDNGYSLSYEIEEWRDQEPVVTIEGQFTKTGVVELSLRVATRLHYEVMGLADTQAASASESESLRRTFPGVVEKKPLRKAYKQEVEAYKSKKQFHSDEALGAHLWNIEELRYHSKERRSYPSERGEAGCGAFENFGQEPPRQRRPQETGHRILTSPHITTRLAEACRP